MRSPVFAFGLLLIGAQAHAEIAVLSNGATLKISGRRSEPDQVVLILKDGGEVGVPPSLIRGYVPDEVLDEIGPVRDADGLRELVTAVARRCGVDPELVLAVVSVESGFQANAVSPKGARGLMQLMPSTAAELGVADAFDPEQNVDGGARHLAQLIERYGGDLRLALAAYNAGTGAVARYRGVPPYRETREYVHKVLRRCAPTR